jgi:hypothetical protein
MLVEEEQYPWRNRTSSDIYLPLNPAGLCFDKQLLTLKKEAFHPKGWKASKAFLAML